MTLTHWLKRPDRNDRAPMKHNPRLHLEALEDRAVPAGIGFDPGTGALTLTGTFSVDHIRIEKAGANTQVTVNSESATFGPGAVKQVNVFAGAGDDSVGVFAADFPVNVAAEGGDDTISVNLGQLNGYLTVSGGEADSNYLDVFDSGNSADTTYSLSAGLLMRGINGSQAASSVEYSGIRTIFLQGGTGNNNFQLESTSAPRVFMLGTTGDDTFEIAPSAQNLDAVAGASEINLLGGDGLDRLIAYDGLNNQSATYNLRVENPYDALQRTGSKSVTITHALFDVLTVKGGSGSNTWNVDDYRTETHLTGGAGSDYFAIGDGPDRLIGSTFLGIGGGGGFDSIDLFDTAANYPKTYEMLGASVRHRPTGSPSTAESQIVFGDVEDVDLFGGSADNSYRVEALGSFTSFTLFAGAGDDTIHLGCDVGLSIIAGPLNVFGGGGFNSMDVDDSLNTYDATYTLTGSKITRVGWQSPVTQITFADVDDLDLFGVKGGSTYNVQGVAAGTDLNIQAGNQGDVFKFGSSNKMNGFLGTVSVSGNGGFDSLDVFDSANTAPTSYSLSASILTRQINGQAQAQVSYDSFEDVGIAGGSAGNTFNVYSTDVGVSSELVGGAGNDTFRVAPHDSNLNAIDGQVTVRGGIGTDSVLIDDSGNAVQTAYNLGVERLSRIIGSSVARINVEDLESMTVLGGTANNTYNALNTDPNMPVEFRAGSGVDTLHVSPVSQTLRTTPGTVSFVGDWVDTIVVHDELNPHPATYVLSANELVRKVAGQEDTTIRFSGDEKLIINAGTGNDILTVASAAALAIPVTFNGGAGNDALKGAASAENTFELTGLNAGKLTIAGGASAVQFSNTENLGGGDRGDRFRFASAGELSGAIDAGFGSDTLDYSALTTGVAVDLSAGVAPRTQSASSIENVFGGSGDDNLRGNDLDNILLGNGGNDVLVGGNGNDVLVGGDGADTISGGAGRNVLIGGRGGDVITGGSDEDILIAGYTLFDNNVPALRSIMAEWVSSAPIETRVGHLLGTIPGGLNSVFLIAGPDPQVPPGGINPDPRSVFDDGVRDSLTGAAGVDWFFFSPNDVTDIVAGEFGTDTGDGTM